MWKILHISLIAFVLVLLFHTSTQSKCTTCKTMVEKFMEGIKKTKKSNFGGGNTKWEENSLGKYRFSETRFLEILESVCSATECHTMLEQHEEAIENWWFKHYAKDKDTLLHDYFCVERLKDGCCPKGKYGPACEECPGGATNPCKGHGTCGGDGTKEGTGECECDSGYEGDLCDKCHDNYLEMSRDETQTTCTACHEACKEGCFELGPSGCNECKEGWIESDEKGCLDTNECERDENPCPDHQYCSNTEGSYKCTNCNIGCNGCTDSGPNNCKECADRYYKDGNNCKACHMSCLSSCTSSGPQNCDGCKEGWVLGEDEACTDVNECDSTQCEPQQHCVNTPGSYRCNTCDKLCDGCTGAGPKRCKQCKIGYKLDAQQECKDEDECANDTDMCDDEKETCINTEGSFKCDCKKGYMLKGGECVKKGEKKKSPTPKKEEATTVYRGPGDCGTCKAIVDNIFKGIDDTEGRNFGGGNTKWEEEKIGSYVTSETRFTEILEQVCRGLSSDKEKHCAHMVERYEEVLEGWWFNNFRTKKDMDLYNHLCINTVEICCPNGTYGRECKECPGGPATPCKGRGKCDGDGTRTGTGACKCDQGFNGTDCHVCADMHYEVERNEEQLICSACDESCSDDGCTGGGPLGCVVCKLGFTRDVQHGCTDNNECETDTPCTNKEYCENTPGSYSCKKCDYRCEGCTGAGNDHCVECKTRHYKSDEDGQCKRCSHKCRRGCAGNGQCLLESSSCDHRCRKGCNGLGGCLGQWGTDFACDRACQSGCTGPDKQHCVGECRFGYIKVEGNGCEDVNECEEDIDKHNCGDDKYCENTPGHYSCKPCEGHCIKCTDASNCSECESGFTLDSTGENPVCVDTDECLTLQCEGENKICMNTEGSYTCECKEGYAQDENSHCIPSTDKKEEL